MEKHYVFIKDNIVKNIAVFSEQNDELAQNIVNEHGFDLFVWINDSSIPHISAQYNPITKEFINPSYPEEE